MPWAERGVVSLRGEFVRLALAGDANIRRLCRRYSVSPKTGYKWIGRFEAHGPGGLEDQSRRPRNTPARTSPEVERAVLAVRDEHPAWGGRKICKRLQVLGHQSVPVPSTATEILRRHGRISPAASSAAQRWQRFEHVAPNDLWQMDFKGHFPTARGECHPLTVLDDHSRFALAIEACANEKTETVRGKLIATFRCAGLPWRMLMDNGAPWGCDIDHIHTPLTVWLMRLSIGVVHCRPYHPETQGKDERFHRTLKAEVIAGHSFRDLTHCQLAFDQWRPVYNFDRPHESLGMGTPGSRWQPSSRSYPETLPPVEYAPGEELRRVQQTGLIYFRGREVSVPKAFKGEFVAVRPTATDGLYHVCFLANKIATIDLRKETLEP
jgi:transposase InsO family protein